MRRATLCCFIAVVGLALGSRSASPQSPGPVPPRDRLFSDPPATDSANPATMAALAIPSGDALMNGVIYIAEGKGPHPTVLLLHGFPGYEVNQDLAQALRRGGWNVAWFHYRGAWGSQGVFSVGNMVEDAAAALAMLRGETAAARFRVDPERIALVGHSFGGFAALMAAARDPKVRAVASIAGTNPGLMAQMAATPGASAGVLKNLAGQIRPLSGTTPEAIVEDVSTHGQEWDMPRHAAALASRSVLLVAGSRDTSSAPALHHAPLVRALREAGAKRLVEHTLDADHSFSDKRIALARIVAAWLESAWAREPGAGRSAQAPVIPTSAIPAESPLATLLDRVPDIRVETAVGTLPRLPRELPAVYRNKAKGPAVRVIWPSPRDNSQVLKPGTYAVTGKVPGTAFQPTATVIVKAASTAVPAPTRTVEPFALSQVVLDQDTKGRDTQFVKNRDKFVQALAATNPDSFLYNFRDAFGQKQPDGVKPLGGWDNQTTRLRGHATGHYLSAISQAYASTTYDEPLRAGFLQKMNYLIDTLYDLSQKSGRPENDGGPFNADPTRVPAGPGRAGYDSNLRAGAIRTDYWNWGKGFISAYPPDQFIMLEQGATYGTQDTQIWAPYYTLHKILAGLLDCYEVGGNRKALEIARNMGAWAYARLKAVPAQTRSSMWSKYIAGEYGGINEVMARLSRLTGDTQFLECAKLFDNVNVFFGNADRDHGLARNVDTIRGKHANQHIPQITGALETFRDTGELPYYLIADNFWDIVTNDYMYSIGGVAGARTPDNPECFTAEPDTLWENGFASGGQNETCCTYNLLKLDRQLFMFDQTAKFMDHYEQGLYNHILASVAEDSPANTYHVPLNPGAQKQFGNATMSGFTCCNGTALESNTKLQDSIYFRGTDNTTLYVNLFVASTLNWTERNLVVRQRTDFPYADTTRLIIEGSGTFDIRIRVPRWAVRGFFVTINGREQSVKAVPGSYLTLRRNWAPNDTIGLRMPFHFYLVPVVDQPNVASLFFGPVLLAAQESAPRTDWRLVTLDAADIAKSITGDPGALQFAIDGVPFKPFFESYGRYSVYLHVSLK
jgi:DUF1680 family protein/pimeloyl-ACP methyl ester carboxylesterase